MGLKKRVEKSAAANMKLEKKIKILESENKLVLLFVFITVIIINKWICYFCRSLLTQLRELQAFVSKYNPSKLQAGSFMMVSNYSCLFKTVVFISDLNSLLLFGNCSSILQTSHATILQ